MTDTTTQGERPAAGRTALRVALLAGLLIRLALISQTSAMGPEVVDEQHYTRLAANLVAGNGFAWSAGAPTSIRPPLYPGVLAAIWTMTGVRAYQAVRAFQIVVALLTTALVYQVGRRVYSVTVGRIAAAVFWLYPSFIFFNFLMLTETVFTFLLAAFVLLAIMLLQRPRAWVAVLCGLSLGLAALTRSVVSLIPLLCGPYLLATLEGRIARRVGLVALVLAGYALVTVPWAIRNTRLQGVLTIVDTMGGRNLRMGNYEYTPDDRMWDAVSLTGSMSWNAELRRELNGRSITEGQQDRWAQQKALEYMRAHPGTTIRRSLIKFADFWGLEREFVAGVRERLYEPPAWFAIVAAILITLSYVVVAISGAAGVWLAPPEQRRFHGMLLLPVIVIVGIHTLVFGHSRYHLPVIPILAVYGSALIAAYGRVTWRSMQLKSLTGAAVSITLLLGIWIQQVLIVDLSRIRGWLDHVR